MKFHPQKHQNIIENRINQIIENISEDFSIETISKSPARFNQKKLDWFNQQYIQKLPLDEFISRGLRLGVLNSHNDVYDKEGDVFISGRFIVDGDKDSFELIGSEVKNNTKYNYYYKSDVSDIKEKSDLNIFILNDWLYENGFDEIELSVDDIKHKLAYKLDQNRVYTLSDLGLESDCVLDYQSPDLEDVKWRKNTLEESMDALKMLNEKVLTNIEFWKSGLIKVLPELSTYPQFDQINDIDSLELLYSEFLSHKNIDILYEALVQEFEESGKKILADNEWDFGLFLWPSRLVLSGKRKSPSIFELMPVLGIKKVSARVEGFLR